MQQRTPTTGRTVPPHKKRPRAIAVALLMFAVTALTTLTPSAAGAGAGFTCTVTDGQNGSATVTWTSAGISRYHLREDGNYKTTVDGFSYEGTAGSSYQVIAWVPGGKLTAECSSTTPPPPTPPPVGDLTCRVADNALISWTQIGQAGQKYQVLADGNWKAGTTGLSYQGQHGVSYQIRAFLSGTSVTADCGDTPAPPPPPPPVDDLVCTITSSATISWNQIGQAAQRYQVLANGTWEASTSALSYQGQQGVSYHVRAFLPGGASVTAECGTANPPPPPPVDDLVCTITSSAIISWNQIGQAGQRYQVLANGTWEASTNALSYQGRTNVSYRIETTINEVQYAAECGSVVPPSPPVCIGLVGAHSIGEGNSSTYYVTLDKPALTATTFTISAQDGSAHRIGDVDGKDRQDIMWAGYYTVNNIFGRVGIVYNRVPNQTNLAYGDRPMVGPVAVDWDYTLYVNGHAQNNSTVTVTVPAGSTTSNLVEVRAWNEKITVDRAADHNAGYTEGTESFALTVNGTHCRADVSINDRSSYNFVSPLVIDLNGDGISTSSIDDADATFDLLGNGEKIKSGWTTDGLLAHDENGDGIIDSGTELFGGGVGDGYAKLATFDSNGDGEVDTNDDRFAELSVWVDADQDRLTDAGELISLTDAGVVSISTSYTWDGGLDNGNLLGETGSVTMSDGTQAVMTDVYFATR